MALGDKSSGRDSDLDKEKRKKPEGDASGADRGSRVKQNISYLWNETPYLRIGVGIVGVGLLIVGLMPSAPPSSTNTPPASQTASGGSLYAPSTPLAPATATTPTQAFAPPSAPDWMKGSAPTATAPTATAPQTGQSAFGAPASQSAQLNAPQTEFTSSVGPIQITGSQSLETKPEVIGTTNGQGAAAPKSPVDVPEPKKDGRLPASGVSRPAVGLDDVFKQKTGDGS